MGDPTVDHDCEPCPHCGADTCGGRIYADWAPRYAETFPDPEDYASPYGWPRNLCGSLVIGIEDPRSYDGVSWWFYPCCGTKTDRWTGEVVTNG